MYLDAESARYGVSVRLKGEVIPNEAHRSADDDLQRTSRTAVHARRSCTSRKARSHRSPTRSPARRVAATASVPALLGQRPARRSPARFSFIGLREPARARTRRRAHRSSNGNAGANTSFTFNLERPEGNQYLVEAEHNAAEGPGRDRSRPSTQCPEPQASQGTCPSASQIGTATVLAGSGPTPFSFSGPVYFTGPYNGAPVRPLDRRPVRRRAVQPGHGRHAGHDQRRASTTATGGRDRHAAEDRQGGPAAVRDDHGGSRPRRASCRNPTNCAALTTASSVTGFVPGSTESATARGQLAVPGRQLRRAGVQARRSPPRAKRRSRKPTARASKRRSSSPPGNRTSSRCSCSCRGSSSRA